MARELIIPFLITANYQTSLAIRQLRGELGQLPAELTALRAAAAEVYAIGAMGLFSLGMLAVGAQQLAGALLSAQRMAALAAVASSQHAAATMIATEILRDAAGVARGSAASLEEISAAYLEAARAGLNLYESSTLLPYALKLAVTSGGEVADTFRMTFAILRNMGIPVTRQTAEVLTSQLSYALDQSLMDIEDVMNAIKYVGPIAGQLRVPLHDLFAALMLLHDAGIKGSIAGTGLSRMLVRLEAPTQQARRALAQLGISVEDIRPSSKELADIIDLLSSRTDELTIRLLLGERAERAFYAIVTQGTGRLRELSRELSKAGQSGDYLARKFNELMRTPAFRMQAAIQDIRTMGSQLVEPLVRLQLTLTEGIRDFLAIISGSPALQIIAKMVIGFGSLGGTIALVSASLSWLIGRFLELGTIWHHLLLVLDRLQAAVRALTLSALKAPLLGITEFARALFTGGGIERLATWISERMRISELASAISQPLVFHRRARRIPPELQPLPEFLALQFGSMAQAAAKLGLPLETFLMAAPTFAGVRATIPRFQFSKENLQKLMRSFYLDMLQDAITERAMDIAKAIGGTDARVVRAMHLLIVRALPERIRALAEKVKGADLLQWIGNLQSEILKAISTKDLIFTPTELQFIGIQPEDLAARKKLSETFAAYFTELNRDVFNHINLALAYAISELPEVKFAGRLSVRAREMIDDLVKNAASIPLEDLEAFMITFYDSLRNTISRLNIRALPFLNEYQRKIQAILRQANVSGILRAFLMGAATIPTDALEDASRFALGAMTGIAANRVRVKNVAQAVQDLANEFGAYLTDVGNVMAAAAQIGISFGLAAPSIAGQETLLRLSQQRMARLRDLERLRVLGVATAAQMEELVALQRQVGILGGMLASTTMRSVFEGLISTAGTRWAAQRRSRIQVFYNMIAQMRAGGTFEPLLRALGSIGIDLPEVIARLIREGEPFINQISTQLATLPDASRLQTLWNRLSRSVLNAHSAIQSAMSPRTIRQLRETLTRFGMTEAQAADVVGMIQSGMLLFLAEQAALGRSLEEAAQVAQGIQRRPPIIGRLAALFAPIFKWISNLIEQFRALSLLDFSFAFGRVGAAFADSFGAAWNAVRSAVTSAVRFLSRFSTFALDIGTILSKPFVNLFTRIFAAIFGSLRNLRLLFTDLVFPLFRGIANVTIWFFSEMIRAAVVAFGPPIRQAIAQAPVFFRSMLTYIWTSTAIGAVFRLIVTFFRVLFSGIASLITEGISAGVRFGLAILEGARQIWVGIRYVISEIGDAFARVFGHIRDALIDWWQSGAAARAARQQAWMQRVASIRALFVAEWQAMVELVTRLWQSIRNRISSAALSLATWLADQRQIFVNWLREVGQASRDLIVAIADAIAASIRPSIQTARQWLAARQQAIALWFATASQTASNFLSGVWQALTQVPDRIIQTIRSLPIRFPTIGTLWTVLRGVVIDPLLAILKAIFVRFPIELAQSFAETASRIKAAVAPTILDVATRMRAWLGAIAAFFGVSFRSMLTRRIAFRMPSIQAAGITALLIRWFVDMPSRAIARAWSAVITALSSIGAQVMQPVFGMLQRVPQFLLGADIIRAVFSRTIGKAILKFFGILGIGGLIASFILDMIPWEDIGRALQWSERGIVHARMSGRFIRTLLGAMLLTLVGVIKGITVDFLGALFDIFRGRGFSLINRWKETFAYFRDTIENMFYTLFLDIEAEVKRLQQTSRLMDISDVFRHFATTVGDVIQSQLSQFAKIQRELIEAQGIISNLYSSLGVAPPGIDERLTRIGDLVATFNLAFTDLGSFAEQMQQARSMLAAIHSGTTGMSQTLDLVSQAFAQLATLPESAWRFGPPEEGVADEFAQRVEDFRRHLFGGSGTESLWVQLGRLREQIMQLPEEQRRQLSGTLEWIDLARRRINEFGQLLNQAAQAPGRYKDEIVRMADELVGVLSREQFRSTVVEPIAGLLRDIQESFAEFKKRLQELADPRAIREFVNSLAQIQFDYLTEGFRQSAEAAQSFNDYLRELGLTTRFNERSASDLLAAYQAVITVLSRPSAMSPAEAFQLLRDAFSRIGDDAKSVQINFQRLYELLQRYNFMQVTAEASMETQRRLSELAKSILDAFKSFREALVETAERFKDAINAMLELSGRFVIGLERVFYEGGQALALLIGQAVIAEQRARSAMMMELYFRAQEMRRLGATEAEIIADLSARWLQFQRTLTFTRFPNIRELSEYISSLRSFSEATGDPVTELAARHAEASNQMRIAARALSAAFTIIQRVGYVSAAAVSYFKQYYDALRQAIDASLDLRVAFRGLSALWDEFKDLLPAGESLAEFAERIALFPTYFAIAIEKIRDLSSKVSRLALIPSWDAFVRRFQLLSQIRDVVRQVFAEPEELAELVSKWSDTLRSFLEKGFVPRGFWMTIPQVRQAVISSLHWLRQFYTAQLSVLIDLANFAIPGTRPWLELNQRLIDTIGNLSQIEEQLRNIRSELLQLELIALPERVAQFIVTQGPALLGFMRTSPFGATSTIQFNIYVSAQDVQAGIMAAMDQATRQLQGFTYRPLIW